MAGLKIRKLIYTGQKYEFESEVFSDGIVLIEGDNGTGKTTFCDLIYFGLGGEVKQFRKTEQERHIEITDDEDNFVQLAIEIDGKPFALQRFIGKNEVTVYEIAAKAEGDEIEEREDESNKEDLIAVYPINRSKNNPKTFSDWILAKLGISVVELYQGYTSFMINFTDLMRLIYHDQQPNPEGIFKQLDKSPNYLTDSELLRKAVFQLLIGKAYSEYYDSVANEKKLDRKKSEAKAILDEYKSIASKLSGSGDVKNTSYLQNEIRQKEKQLEQLKKSREKFKRGREVSEPSDSSGSSEISKLKSVIVGVELESSRLQESILELYSERYNIVSLIDASQRELDQIEKVIFTHDQLNLFTPDTCPYCLSKVDRAEGECVCGAPVEEAQFERFFYSALEYQDILKSKLKAIETINNAKASCDNDLKIAKSRQLELESTLRRDKDRLAALIKGVDTKVDFETIDKIDDTILDTRDDISELRRMYEIELKVEELQKRYDEAREKSKKAELKRRELEVEAEKDIQSKVTIFGEFYELFMKNTLPECRSASLSNENYMPLINGGVYREASSKVPIRLMYYLTFLALSLGDDSVQFPRFLLIDTPETAGIEPEGLKNCISQFLKLQSVSSDFQVIFATGLGKYPAELEEYRALYLPDKNTRLLKERNVEDDRTVINSS